jgi:hypothetical protein
MDVVNLSYISSAFGTASHKNSVLFQLLFTYSIHTDVPDEILKVSFLSPRVTTACPKGGRIQDFRLSVSEANILVRKQPTQLATGDKNGFASQAIHSIPYLPFLFVSLLSCHVIKEKREIS